MSALSRVLRIRWCVIVTTMKVSNCLLPFFWHSVWSLFPLVIIQNGLPSRHSWSLTWCARIYMLVFYKGVYPLVFPWLRVDGNWLFGFTSQLSKTISARYHLSWNNVSINLEVLIIRCSILQTAYSIISLSVDANKFSQWSIRAAIIFWENKKRHYTGDNLQLLLGDPVLHSGDSGMRSFDHGIQHYELFRFFRWGKKNTRKMADSIDYMYLLFYK